MNAARVTFCL
uniref:Uncharacterized protein n=1 Tax=Anguilla anguilla TaxID=7936 RepID=A0A0E9QJ38_ANGAN